VLLPDIAGWRRERMPARPYEVEVGRLRTDADARLGLRGPLSTQRFRRFQRRVDEPYVLDPLARIDGKLPSAIDRFAWDAASITTLPVPPTLQALPTAGSAAERRVECLLEALRSSATLGAKSKALAPVER